jgi:hypothetical protein
MSNEARTTSGRDLRKVEQPAARLKELLVRDTPVSRREIVAAEGALIKALESEFYGVVIFSPVRSARPHCEALLELAAGLVARDRRGELPLPTASRSIFGVPLPAGGVGDPRKR